jgi:hypothetical protein
MSLHRLSQCRAALNNYLKQALAPTPALVTGEVPVHPHSQYVELRYNGPDTPETGDSQLRLNINVITIPSAGSNIYTYIDLAYQIHDILLALSISVAGVGCLVQNGSVVVADFEYVNPEKTIQQANVTCTFLLET